MRTLKPVVGGGVIALVVLLAAPAVAVETVALPFTVPRGALVEVSVTSCPVPATTTAVARLSPAGGAVEEESTGAVEAAGAATLVPRVPIDAALGAWTVAVSCLDASGAVVDGPVTADLTVASLALLTIEPRAGRAGGTITVSGTGCPTGITDSVFARIAGGSDDPIPLWDQATPGTRLELSPGGSFTGPFTVPIDSPEGENQVWAYCISEGGAGVAGPIAGVFEVDNSLPPTGAPLTVVALAAIGALVVGLALVIPARQRSRANG